MTIEPNYHIKMNAQSLERDMAQWLGRGLPAVRFRNPLGAGFSDKYHVSSLSLLGHLFLCCVLGQFALKCFTGVGQRLAMCTINSMHRNGCRTVCSPCS